MTDATYLPPVILTADEIRAITGAVAPSVQLNELRRLGFTRARRGLDKSLIVERAHYEAVCAGAVVLSPGKLEKAADKLIARVAIPASEARTAPLVPAPPLALPTAAPPPPPTPPVLRASARKITIEEWAVQNYSNPPTRWVLGQWRRAGQIHPEPERVGRTWYVFAKAVRIVNGIVHDGVSLVDRIGAREGR